MKNKTCHFSRSTCIECCLRLHWIRIRVIMRYGWATGMNNRRNGTRCFFPPFENGQPLVW